MVQTDIKDEWEKAARGQNLTKLVRRREILARLDEIDEEVDMLNAEAAELEEEMDNL